MPQVAAGGTHSVVLTREGHVWTWGQPWPPGDMYGALKIDSVKLFLCIIFTLAILPTLWMHLSKHLLLQVFFIFNY